MASRIPWACGGREEEEAVVGSRGGDGGSSVWGGGEGGVQAYNERILGPESRQSRSLEWLGFYGRFHEQLLFFFWLSIWVYLNSARSVQSIHPINFLNSFHCKVAVIGWYTAVENRRLLEIHWHLLSFFPSQVLVVRMVFYALFIVIYCLAVLYILRTFLSIPWSFSFN